MMPTFDISFQQDIYKHNLRCERNNIHWAVTSVWVKLCSRLNIVQILLEFCLLQIPFNYNYKLKTICDPTQSAEFKKTKKATDLLSYHCYYTFS